MYVWGARVTCVVEDVLRLHGLTGEFLKAGQGWAGRIEMHNASPHRAIWGPPRTILSRMTRNAEEGRGLSVPMLIGVVAIYLIIVQGVGLTLLSGQDYNYGEFPDAGSIVRAATIPVALSLIFGVIVVTWLGWWGRVLHETLRLGRWAWIFPGLMVVSILVATDYPNLGDVGAKMTLTLLASSLLVGLGEELMFRGITLESMRRVAGSTELSAALWTTVIFGGVHLTNIFTEGPSALFQVAVVSVAGLFFYIARRVSGGLLIPILLHAGWDFSLFSGHLGDPDFYALSVVAALTITVLAIIMIVRRHAIWPKNPQPTPAQT